MPTQMSIFLVFDRLRAHGPLNLETLLEITLRHLNILIQGLIAGIVQVC